MNKERKDTLAVLINVLKAAQREGAGPHLLKALDKGVEATLISEERARKAMEPYKDSPNTAANYRNTASSISHLDKALIAITESDLESAVDHLEAAVDPSSRQVHKPARRARK